ncbi:MAG: prepilin-type N-terminal cleavage/methylation domain-containing protein [Candidatus Pacebacteria bacterium]|nr:prepilin-type N-terminal cleavage/methylation domain-containing protein [Candidatus Paceibacterota bacterium]MBP9840587.1 prepilin-type N-terminal cleavage/methylation domain-containing protein [Candidatus Paceibacterota bacterium]
MRGFTLIEAVIYLALLSLLMLGCASLAFGVGRSTDTDQSELRTAEEGAFVLAKLRAAVHQSAGFEEVTVSEIRLEAIENFSDSVEFEHDDEIIYTRRGGGLRVPLTTLSVTEAAFAYEDEVLHAYFMLGGREFSTSFYLP